jgi:hypothetical protein|tara:strand:+ start:1165 stop:1968 length:804 start_codon:yes stop_codon:yes gene_type:complete
MKNIFKIAKLFFNNNFSLKYEREISKSKPEDFKEIKNTKKYKIKIITSYDDKYKNIGDITSKTFKKYAEKYDYVFENVKMPKMDRPYAWSKINILLDEIQKNNFEYLLWVDADSYFNNYEKNISEIIDEKKEIYMVKHYCEVHKGTKFKNTKLTILRINSGVMLLKSSDYNYNFLTKVWNNKKFINHPWWEQAAIMDIIGFRAELNHNLNDNIGNSILDKIKFLSGRWNSIPSNLDLSMEKHNPIIIHMAGMKNENREKYLKKNLLN